MGLKQKFSKSKVADKVKQVKKPEKIKAVFVKIIQNGLLFLFGH